MSNLITHTSALLMLLSLRKGVPEYDTSSTMRVSPVDIRGAAVTADMLEDRVHLLDRYDPSICKHLHA